MTVRSLEELDALELLTATPMSYSRLNTYEMCRSKYFYTYIIREPRQFAVHAVLGNIIHSTLENVLEDKTKVSDLSDKLSDEYKVQISDWDPDNKIPKDLIDAGTVMIDEFIDRHADEILPIHAKEIGFQIVLGSFIFRGYIDRLDIVGDIVYVLDWKTGKREVPEKHVHKDLQLGLYALAMKKMYPDKQIHASLYYLRSGKQKGHLFSDEDLKMVEASLIEKCDQVINDNTFSPTKNRFLCGFCDHATSGACVMGQYAKR